jgi:hypothetical protein
MCNDMVMCELLSLKCVSEHIAPLQPAYPCCVSALGGFGGSWSCAAHSTKIGILCGDFHTSWDNNLLALATIMKTWGLSYVY